MSEFQQRDLGDAAEASAGGGAKGMRSEFWTLIGLASVVIVVVGVVFALAGELAVRWISAEQEAELFGGLEAQLPVVTPTKALEADWQRAHAILEKLKQQATAPKVDFKLVLLGDSKPNAFALPGGAIGVTRGLLTTLKEEVELAFVLGHEIGHFKHRDHLRRFFRDVGRTTALAVLFGDASGAVSGVDQWLAMKFSRDQEHRADRFGVELVYACYGTVEGTERLFEVLAEEERGPRWSHAFSSHPESKERIARLRGYAEEVAVKPSDQKAGSRMADEIP